MTRRLERMTNKLKAGERVRLSPEGKSYYAKKGLRSHTGTVTKKQVGLTVGVTVDGWKTQQNFHPDYWERENVAP